MKPAKIMLLLGLLTVLGVVSYRSRQTSESSDKKAKPVRQVDQKAKTLLERADEAAKTARVVKYAATYDEVRSGKQKKRAIREKTSCQFKQKNCQFVLPAKKNTGLTEYASF